jgi:hypothetical protein
LGNLAELFDVPGPFASVYLHDDAAVENAAAVLDRRWRDLRRDLTVEGVPAHVLAELDAVIVHAPEDGELLAVLAGGGLTRTRRTPEPPARDRARWAALPSIGPLVEALQRQLDHVIVLVDRIGADIVVFRRDEPERVLSVAGDPDDPLVHKSQAGGWSQRRYQQRTENAWDEAARDVAALLTRVVDRFDPRMVLLGGDEHAVHLLRQHLPDRVSGRLHAIDGTRAAGSDAGRVAEQTARLVATTVAEDTVTILEQFREERGQHDRAAEGAAATIAALNAAQVETLLVHDDWDDPRTAWFGEAPVPVALDGGVLDDLGVDDPRCGRLPDVLVRAAFGTGAGVRMIPGRGPVGEGIGALLRFS